MELNILKLVLDRAGRITNSQNLSLNQCSSNNRLKVYYEGEYDYIECSFRKPDGWLSDKLTLTFDVDEELFKYAYVDIPEDFVTFPMGGRNAILVGNLYLHKGGAVASLGNIRINVNYVDDSLVHTNYSENYMANINSQIGALQNDLNRFKTGDVLVGKAISDRKGNTIDIYYETKADALDKYDDLNQKKLDKSEVQDQTNRLELLEANATNVSGILSSMEKINTNQSDLISENSSEIDTLKTDKVSLDRFREESAKRVAKENELQTQINELASSSNVNDIVGSFTKLLEYNTTDLEIGYKILVSEDKNQGNVSTIYRYTGDGPFNGFEYIGKYASTSYTKTEINDKLNELQIPNDIAVSNNSMYLKEDGVQVSKNPVKFKTINGETIFGTGNITYPVDDSLNSNSTNPVQNKIIAAQLEQKISALELGNVEKELTKKIEGKQNTLKAGSNITITEDGTISVTSAIRFEKVESLPTTGSSNVIYLLRTVNDESRDEIYTEYYWDEENGKWESLGDATIDLGNYYTILQTDTLLSNKANQSALESLSKEVSTNKTDLATKASQASVDTINSSISVINTALNSKAEKSELDKFALKESIPDVSSKQDKLVSGQNIKTINGVDILGYGDLLLADTEIVDLGEYVKNEDLEKTLEDYAQKSELFDLDYTKLKNKPDLEIFPTEEEMATYVGEQIAAIPPTDLSNYYTKEEVDTAIETHVPDLEGYATEDFVRTEINAIVDNAPDAYNTLKEISDYIASDETNAANMLASINQNTEKISLNTGYIDRLETRVDETIANIGGEFANRYTKDEVDALLENLDVSGLENYYTKTEVDDLLDNVDVDLTGYATEKWVNEQGYVKKSDNTFALKSEIIKSYNDLTDKPTIPSIDGLASETYVENYVDDKLSVILDAAPETFDTFKEIADYIESDLTNSAAMLASINNKADKSEVYTQTEANAKFVSKEDIPVIPDMSKYYTKEETVEVIDKVSGLDNYYDKDDIDAALLNKQDILVSGSTIKTINGESIVGYGNLEITGTKVVGNPELDGGEDILESIQIEDTKYSLQGQDMTFSENLSENPDRKVLKTISIENEDWIVDKGSVVTPNVELNGDEPILESVQIDENVFTLKGEEMIFSETAVEGATALRNIQLGDDNWGIPDPDLSEYYTKTEIDNQLLSEITFSEEAKDGYNLKSITVGETVWNVGGVTESYVDQRVAALVNSAPETLDTLGELATALEENSSLVDTLNTLINQKADKSEVEALIGDINTILASLVEVE